MVVEAQGLHLLGFRVEIDANGFNHARAVGKGLGTYADRDLLEGPGHTVGGGQVSQTCSASSVQGRDEQGTASR